MFHEKLSSCSLLSEQEQVITFDITTSGRFIREDACYASVDLLYRQASLALSELKRKIHLLGPNIDPYSLAEDMKTMSVTTDEQYTSALKQIAENSVKPSEITQNCDLANVLQRNLKDYVVRANVTLTSNKCTKFLSSRPDFCLFH